MKRKIYPMKVNHLTRRLVKVFKFKVYVIFIKRRLLFFSGMAAICLINNCGKSNFFCLVIKRIAHVG